MKVSKRVRAAAGEFFLLLFPDDKMSNISLFDHPKRAVRDLVIAAFHLYDKEWGSCLPYNIRQWEYPKTTLMEGKGFTGDTPWDVLLNKAVVFARGLGWVRPKKKSPLTKERRNHV